MTGLSALAYACAWTLASLLLGLLWIGACELVRAVLRRRERGAA